MAEAGRSTGLPPSTANGGGPCAQLFYAPVSGLSSSSELSSPPFLPPFFGLVFSWLSLPASSSQASSLPPFSWRAPSWQEPSWEAGSGRRHPPMVLRAPVPAQGPILCPRESRRLPLRERALLPLLPLLPNPLPAIRRRRRCRCTHPSRRPDRIESDH